MGLDQPNTSHQSSRGKPVHGFSGDEPYCRTLFFSDRVVSQTTHSHRFIELLQSLDGTPIAVDYGGDVRSALSHVVAPCRKHAIIHSGAVARMYVAMGMRAISPFCKLVNVGNASRSLAEELVTLRGKRPSDESERITLTWQEDWVPDFNNAPKIEPRIERAVRYIDVRRDPSTTRLTAAGLANLSASRFAALFFREMGMPLGRYIIWRRLLIALEYLKIGDSTTKAAMAAGFSDAPHLCRCYRSTFGSPPSLLPTGRMIQHGFGLEFLREV